MKQILKTIKENTIIFVLSSDSDKECNYIIMFENSCYSKNNIGFHKCSQILYELEYSHNIQNIKKKNDFILKKYCVHRIKKEYAYDLAKDLAKKYQFVFECL